MVDPLFRAEPVRHTMTGDFRAGATRVPRVIAATLPSRTRPPGASEAMPRSIAGRRLLLALAGTIPTTATLVGCQQCNQPRRPIGEGVREYFAARPAYNGMPARTFTIGSYAGYNYGRG